MDELDNTSLLLLNDDTHTYFDIIRKSESAINLIFYDTRTKLSLLWEIDKDLHESDHYPIYITLNKYLRAFAQNQGSRGIYSKSTNWEKFRDEVSSHLFSLAFDNDAFPDSILNI